MQAHQVEIYLEEARLTLENDFSETRLHKVLVIYQEAIAQFPEVAVEPYLVLGYVALRLKRFDEARIFLTRAASVEPFNPVVRKLLHYLNQNQPTP